MRLFVLFMLLVLLPAQLGIAQEAGSTFQVNFDFTDYDPPSVPANVAATPLSATEITVSWDASTDNFTVTGYVVYRDLVAIATTTQTTYLDMGLTPATPYTYAVQAFDQSGNYSATSTAVVATTLSSGNSGATKTTPTLKGELEITPSYTSADISIATNRPARFEISWGQTEKYELGTVSNNQNNDRYNARLGNLEPGTTYFYEVAAFSARGDRVVLETGSFTTLTTITPETVPNVLYFRGERMDDSVQLRWQLPNIPNLDYIRIVRSHFDYPRTLTDGVAVYQGEATGFFDEGILSEYSPVYYTAFVVDTSGAISSGAITRVSATEETGSGYAGEEGVIINDPPTATTDKGVSPDATDARRIPGLDEILIQQGGDTKSFFSTPLDILQWSDFTISIPRAAVSKQLKTILFSFTSPTDVREEYSYILRINDEGTAYEATISGLSVAGTSWFTLEIYDYEARTVSTYRKEATFIEPVSVIFSLETLLNQLQQHWLPFLLGIIILILIMVMLYGVLHEREKLKR